MADVFSSSLAARLLNKPVAHASTFMDSLLPLVILLLSMTLIATSVIRRALEKGYGRRPKWARHSWKAFAALRRQLEASEVPALKPSWLQVVYEQEANEVVQEEEDEAPEEEKPRRRRTQRRGKNARTSHVPAGRAGAPEAAEPTASELEEQPQSSSESDVSEPEVIHKVHVEAVVTSDASDAEESTARDEDVAEEAEEAAELEAEAPAEEADAEDEEVEQLCDFSTPVPCTSEEEMIYSASLLLAHREICLRIARGAPGLTKPEGCAPTTEDAAPLQEASKETPKEKSPKKAPQPAVHCTPEELQAMEPPMRKGKLVVGESDLTIYINADQSRYQIYRNGRELRSLAWGGSSTSRLRASWKKVLEMAAPIATRKGSSDLLEP